MGQPEHFDETFSVDVRGPLPEEIANAVRFLASDQSSFVTGSQLFRMAEKNSISPRYA